jgi:beta propeller repeat protein
MYYLSTSTEIQITNNGESHNPAIYNDRIVWYDYRNGNQDVYMFTLAPDVELTPLDRTNDLKDMWKIPSHVMCGQKKLLLKLSINLSISLERRRIQKLLSRLNPLYIERFIYFYCHVCVLKIKRYIIICY